MTGLKNIEDLDEELWSLQTKLAAVEQKKLKLLEEEGSIRTEMQRVENQIYRLKKAQEKSQE